VLSRCEASPENVEIPPVDAAISTFSGHRPENVERDGERT